MKFSKTYYIKTYGCQANIADSQTLAGILETLGFEELVVDSKNFVNEIELDFYVLSNTDLFLINTCSVRQKSEDKVFGLGKTIKRLNDEGKKKPFIVVSGCMVGSVKGERQRYQFEELQKRTSWSDLYISPSQFFDLPEKLLENKVVPDWVYSKFNRAEIMPKTISPKKAYINISNGCDNFCSFCVVPYSRGKETSRPKEDIVREIKHSILQGASNITLCGQNVNSWGLSMDEKFNIRLGSDQKLPFASLLREVHEIEGLTSLEFISSNPFDFTSDLIDVLTLPKISNYLHIAVQSGNNDILTKMNRRHTIEDFINLIRRIKKVKPEIEIGTDIIVGFPGETEKQFMDTVDLFEKIRFNVAFISMYSQRKGTKAEKYFPDDVPLKEKKYRHAYLTKVWRQTKK